MNTDNTNSSYSKIPVKKSVIDLSIKLLVALMVILSSCTPQRKMVYLQHKNQITDTLNYSRTDYTIRPGDILYVRILTLDEESNAIFNNEGSQRLGAGGGGSNMTMFLYGYTVNEQGEVILPVLGSVSVAGKTVDESVKELEVLVAEYLIGATVIVKLVNFSVTVTGEVGSPGRFYVYDNQISIIDALSMAGDLTDFGNRKVNIIRQTNDGKGVTYAILDITDPRIITSEYYFLQPYDLVYVEPQWVKRIGFVQTPFSVLLSTITTALLLINYFTN
jgi:polysaccharide biosynthesis/export protein